MADNRISALFPHLGSRQISARHALTIKTLEVPMRARSLLFGIAVLSLSFLATAIETPARDPSRFQRVQNARSSRDTFMRQEQFRSTPKRVSLRVSVLKPSKRDVERRIKSIVKRCGCAAPAQDSDFSRSCFTGCLKDWGVSAASLAACAGSCAGTLVGCAVCLGVTEWVVLGCAQYCVWRDVIGFEQGSVSNRPRPFTKRPIKRPVSMNQGAS